MNKYSYSNYRYKAYHDLNFKGNISFKKANKDFNNFKAQNKPKRKKGKAVLGLMLASLALLSKCSQSPKENIPQNQTQSNVSTVHLDINSDEYFANYINTSLEQKEAIEALEKQKPLKKIYGQKACEELATIISKDTNTINGQIDENIAQGIINDCWLITGIENLSYTPNGARLIKEAISQNEQGDIEVFFKGPNLKYTITQEEIKNANKKTTLYSKGDDDMLILELAAEKFRQDILDNKIEKNPNIDEDFYYSNQDEFTSLNFGETRQAYWLLSGNTKTKEATTQEEFEEVIDEFTKRPQNSLLDVELKKDAKVKDINGEEFTIFKYHGYGVKKIENEYITLISASYSNKEITISLEDLYNLPIAAIILAEI